MFHRAVISAFAEQHLQSSPLQVFKLFLELYFQVLLMLSGMFYFWVRNEKWARRKNLIQFRKGLAVTVVSFSRVKKHSAFFFPTEVDTRNFVSSCCEINCAQRAPVSVNK